MAGVPASSGQKGSEDHRLMLFMASGSSPRCFFQLRAQIQTVVEVFVSKLRFEGHGMEGPTDDGMDTDTGTISRRRSRDVGS